MVSLEFQTFPESMEKYQQSKRGSYDLSTCEGDGDSSSEATGEAFVPAPRVLSSEKFQRRGRSPAAGATRAPAVQDDADDDYDDQDNYQYDMPSTREPSPEPMWNNPGHYAGEYIPQYNQMYLMPGQQVPEQKGVAMMQYPNFVPIAPRNEHPMQRLHPTTPQGDMFLMPTALPSATHAPRASNAKPEPKTSSKQREPKNASKQPEEVRSKTSKGKGQGSRKANAKTRAEVAANGDTFSNLSDEKKQVLGKYIYDLMLEKEFTSPDGYLLVDVLAEVWKHMGDGATGGRIAQHRFAELLRSAPQYFELFRKGIRVTNHCGWFARKGEKMVRLVLPTSM